MLTLTTMDAPSLYCPKRGHVKPCWCGGVARCFKVVRDENISADRFCKRIVCGPAGLCWQHGPKGDSE